MKKRIKSFIKEIVLFSLVFFLLSSAINLYRSSQMRLDDSICKEDVSLVHFWATWCPVCKAELGNIAFVASKYRIETIAVHSGDTREIASFLEKNEVHIPFRADPKSSLAQRYGINVYPTTIICSQGKVRFSETGYTSTIGLLVRLWLARLNF